LKVTIHPNFSAEKKYIIRVLMEVYLGLDYSIEMGETHEYKLTLKNGNSLIFADDFFKHFSEKENYLHKKNIPKRVRFVTSEFAPLNDIPVIFGNLTLVSPSESLSQTRFRRGWKEAHAMSCGIDIFAGAFFMLSRWEEMVNPVRDVHERFPAEASLAFKCNFLHRAVVNEYVELLWNMLTHLGIEQGRKVRKFSKLLTHDVDIPRLWRNAFSPIKTTLGDIFKRKNKVAARQHFSYWKQKKDPFDTFDALMELSENQNLTSHFFFISGGKTNFESNYNVEDFYIKKLIAHIHERGHVVGIHPSYDTYRDGAMLSWEIEALRAVSPQSVKMGRQHFLRFAVPYTWQVWEDNGMTWDSTMGYAGAVGFRCGTCYAFPVFNVLTRNELNLVERPLLVMEVSLFSEAYMGLNQVEALEKVQEIMETVRHFEGEFVLLWHNSNLVLNGEDYWATYEAILNV